MKTIYEVLCENTKGMVERILKEDKVIYKIWLPRSITYNDIVAKLGRYVSSIYIVDITEMEILDFGDKKTNEEYFTEDEEFYKEYCGMFNVGDNLKEMEMPFVIK